MPDPDPNDPYAHYGVKPKTADKGDDPYAHYRVTPAEREAKGAADIPAWLATQGTRAITGTVGGIEDLQQLGNEGVKWVMRHTVDPKFGDRPSTRSNLPTSPVNIMPGSADLNRALVQATGEPDVTAPKSWGMAGRMLDTGTQAVLSGGRSILRNAAPNVLASVASEGVGSLAHEIAPKYEAAARFISGLLGGAAGSTTQSLLHPNAAPGPRTPIPGSQERSGLFNEFGVSPTRGDISQTPRQLHTEQTLAQTPNTPAGNIMQQKLASQDVERGQAGQTLRAGAGTPLTIGEAGQVMKTGYEAAANQGDAKVNAAYDRARDPATLQANNIPQAIPNAYIRQLGQTVRNELKKDEVGQLVLGGNADTLTPMASAAMKQIEAWSKGSLGDPTAMLNWNEIESLRKQLNLFRKGAVGNDTDQRAMASILRGFDEHLGNVNPLYKPARDTASQHYSNFEPNQPGQDKATSAALKALQGPEGGVAIVDQIFGGSMSKGTAEQTIDHLMNTVFANQPAAKDAMKQMALRRLVTDEKGKTLTPAQTVTKIEQAFGEREGPLYQKMFTSDELDKLKRFQQLNETLAKSRKSVNPPLTAFAINAVLSKVGSGIAGTALGFAAGHDIASTLAGALTGEKAGPAAQSLLNRVQAGRAVNPPPNFTPIQPGPVNMTPAPGGMLNATQSSSQPAGGGLLDRFWQGIYGGGM